MYNYNKYMAVLLLIVLIFLKKKKAKANTIYLKTKFPLIGFPNHFLYIHMPEEDFNIIN